MYSLEWALLFVYLRLGFVYYDMDTCIKEYRGFLISLYDRFIRWNGAD